MAFIMKVSCLRHQIWSC